MTSFITVYATPDFKETDKAYVNVNLICNIRVDCIGPLVEPSGGSQYERFAVVITDCSKTEFFMNKYKTKEEAYKSIEELENPASEFIRHINPLKKIEKSTIEFTEPQP